jgi:hypothetical protein
MSDNGPGGKRRIDDCLQYEATATLPQNFPGTGQNQMSKAYFMPCKAEFAHTAE